MIIFNDINLELLSNFQSIILLTLVFILSFFFFAHSATELFSLGNPLGVTWCEL